MKILWNIWQFQFGQFIIFHKSFERKIAQSFAMPWIINLWRFMCVQQLPWFSKKKKKNESTNSYSHQRRTNNQVTGAWTFFLPRFSITKCSFVHFEYFELRIWDHSWCHSTAETKTTENYKKYKFAFQRRSSSPSEGNNTNINTQHIFMFIFQFLLFIFRPRSSSSPTIKNQHTKHTLKIRFFFLFSFLRLLLFHLANDRIKSTTQ